MNQNVSVLFSIISVIATLSLTLLAIYRLIKKSPNSNLGFVLLNFSLTLWQAAKIAIPFADHNLIYLQTLDRLSFCGALGVAPSFFLLANQLSYSFNKRMQFWVTISWASFATLVVLVCNNQVILSTNKMAHWGYFHKPLWGYALFLIDFSVFIIWGLIRLSPKSLKKYPILLLQNKFIISTASLGIFFGTFEIWGVLVTPIFPIANLSPLAFSLGLWWSVYRFNLLDSLNLFKQILRLIALVFGCLILTFIASLCTHWLISHTNLHPILIQTLCFSFVLIFATSIIIPFLKNWAPMSYLDSRSLQQFQIWLASQTQEQELFNGILDLAQEFKYQSIHGILLDKVGETRFVQKSYLDQKIPPILLAEHSKNHNKVLHIQWILRQLRTVKLSEEDRKSHLRDLKFLRRLQADIWIPLTNLTPNQDWHAAIWMKSPQYKFEDIDKVMSTLIALSAAASTQLSQIIHNNTMQKNRNLENIGLLTASLAHEIRNPLQSIVLSADMLSEKLPQEKLVQFIQKESNRLEHLLSLFLKWTKEIKPELVSIELKSFLLNIYDEEIMRTPQLELIGLPETEIFIKSDPNLLKHILLNLIRNAQKHSPTHEKIQIRLELLSHSYQFVVRDWGSGVEHPDRLFQPFYTTSPSGHGLGLAFAKKAAIALHSQLKYMNPNDLQETQSRDPKQGSIFILECPFI
jgi:signal transduction histidine kinase